MSDRQVGNFVTAADFFASLADVATPERIGGVTGVVCFEIRDAGSWTVTLVEGDSSVVAGTTDNYDAKITTDEERLLSIVRGQASARRLFMTGKVKVKGKLALAIKLDQLLALT